MDFLESLEQSGFSQWVSQSGSLLGYPTILFLHTLGLGVVAGISAGIDLRLLGFAPQLPLESMRKLFPILWAGFAVIAASGVALLVADATTKLTQPVFYVKMLFVALALVNTQVIKTRVFADAPADSRPLAAGARVLSVTSLFFWIAATTAGRLMAYIN
jgi:hypothetical protein